MMMLVFCLLLAHASATMDVANLCPGTVPLLRARASGHGSWWTVAGTNMTSGRCGINNNQLPCECTGFVFASDLNPPCIPTYNATAFGYNQDTLSYEKQEALLTLVDDTQPWAIFNFIDKSSGSSVVVSALDTDEHKTYIVFYICGVTSADGEPIVIVVAKTRDGLNEESQKQVDAVLKKNNISKDKLIKFNPKYCPTL